MKYNILLMSGRGKRFTDKNYEIPKPLLPIGEKMMFEASMSNFPDCDKWIFTVTPEIANNSKFISFKKNFDYPLEVLEIKKTTSGQASSTFLVTKELRAEDSCFIGSCDAIFKEKIDLLKLNKSQFSVITSLPSLSQIENPESFGWVVKGMENYSIYCKEKILVEKKISNVILGYFYFKKIEYFNNGFRFMKNNNLFVNNELYIDVLAKHLLTTDLKFLNYEVKSNVVGTPKEYEEYIKYEL
tara:strand:+ start:3410 stop:4135 length:726 start_codon:yes stop_codon:yes gene_type:complete